MTVRVRYDGRRVDHSRNRGWYMFEIQSSKGTHPIHMVQNWVKNNIQGEKWLSLIMSGDMYVTYRALVWIRNLDQATLFKLTWGGEHDPTALE